MKIEVQHIPSRGATLAYRREAREFAVLKELEEQDQCRFTTPLDIDLAVAMERDMVKVNGHFSTSVQLACSRCLERFLLPLQRRFSLRFSREIPAGLHTGGGEVELTADAIGLIYFKGEEIQLQDTIQEQVVLALPFKPLCREDCKGLCPQCGADLNAAPCACGAVAGNNPFAVLKSRQWPLR